MKILRSRLSLSLGLFTALLIPKAAPAQQPAPEATPAAVAKPAPLTPPAPSVLAAPAVQSPPFELDPAFAPKAPAAKPAPAPAKPAPVAKKGEIMLNFQGASLADVLSYLSDAAGFVIVQEAPVTGTVNVMSRQPINAEEAVDLLNTVLTEKGYIAIRNGRILKIVSRKDAQKRDLPVQTGSDPERIPRKDEVVTQILPLRFGEAAKLVENLRPLLVDTATISANESSNSILLTDTQTNIRRIAEIIRAIDTSVANISTIHVYPLQYANAKELATVITALFANNTTSGANNQNQRGGGRRGGGFPFPFGGGAPGGAPASTAADSEARQANSRVIAVADDQSNSLIVSAPEDLIPSITDVVTKIDTSTTDVTSTHIFNLKHADAVETADIINTLYSDATSQTSGSRNQRNGANGRQNQQGGGFGGQQAAASSSSQSERALLQARVVAVGDGRTNSLLVNAARDAMTEISEMIGRLDATDAKKQHVYVHSLEHADVDGVAGVLRGMLGGQTSTTTQTSRLTDRSTQGAAMDTSQISNSGGGGGSGRSAR